MFTHRMVYADGTPADPPTFTSSEPNWRVGDLVRVGADARLRIVRIDQHGENEPPTWTVAPVGNSQLMDG